MKETDESRGVDGGLEGIIETLSWDEGIVDRSLAAARSKKVEGSDNAAPSWPLLGSLLLRVWCFVGNDRRWGDVGGRRRRNGSSVFGRGTAWFVGEGRWIFCNALSCVVGSITNSRKDKSICTRLSHGLLRPTTTFVRGGVGGHERP